MLASETTVHTGRPAREPSAGWNTPSESAVPAISGEARPFFQAVSALPGQAGALLSRVPAQVGETVLEVRLRCGKPIHLYTTKGHLFLGEGGNTLSRDSSRLPKLSQTQLESCFYALCDYSIHTHQEDIRQGFVTLRGGHRAGISGSCVWENGQPAGIRDVSSICIRVARQKKGAADRLAAMLLTGEIGGGILIVGAPGSGKTTLLRDLARQLAGGLTGTYYRVAAVDERGELGAAADGVPQNDLGVCCDLLDGFPKGEGIEIAVRTLSPDFILCDELGGAEEIEAVRQSLCRGVRMAASIHATDLDELLARPGVRELLGTGAFSHLILLGKRPGEPFASIPVKEVLI